jgi:hypothetical protein
MKSVETGSKRQTQNTKEISEVLLEREIPDYLKQIPISKHLVRGRKLRKFETFFEDIGALYVTAFDVKVVGI